MKSKAKSNSKSKLLIVFIILLCLLAVVTAGGIYLIAKEPWRKAQWTITEYASTTGNQSMFYTITDLKGNLVVIDGGFDSDADQVKNVILDNGGHVSAWIITHPHPDHVGAFNALYPTIGDAGITVDKVYATDVNYDRYKETAQDYDGFAVCEAFYNLAPSIKNLTYLHENDEFDLLPGLKMKVLHGWDENVDALPDHLVNNGSLMFKIYGNEQSMLFCADTQKEVEDQIIKDHGDELKSDYVQCGHHGNWGVTTKFYDKVAPTVAFMDGPEWLIEDTSGLYDAPALKDYFIQKDVHVYEQTTAPNKIVLK